MAVTAPSVESAARVELPPPVQFEKGESSGASVPISSWLDLPDHLAETILERLDAADYVRFGAVCRRWLSLQSNHRRRYSPSAPPMVKRPWFIPCHPTLKSVPCADPFSDGDASRPLRLELPLSETYLEFRRTDRIHSKYMMCFMALNNGWFLMDGRPLGKFPYPRGYHLSLLNPLLPDHRRVVLPVLEGHHPFVEYDLKAAASYPGSTPITLLAVMQDQRGRSTLQMFRTNQDQQQWLYLPCEEFEDPKVHVTMTDLAFCQGKFYVRYVGSRLLVVDPRSEQPPQVCQLDMDVSMLPKDLPWLRWDSTLIEKTRSLQEKRHLEYLYDSLVESDGRLLLLIHTYHRGYAPIGRTVYVFAADFDRNQWVKVDSLGDRVLLVYGETQNIRYGKKQALVVSLLADDIGAKKNCIYVLDLRHDHKPTLWVAFDVQSGEMTRAPLGYAPPFTTHIMFVPSIC